MAKPEQVQSPERAQRFLREARSAANLRHPHIVPVFDSGSDGEHSYIASAFIAGCSLEQHVQTLPSGQGLAPRQAATIVRHLAEALAYAHGKGVIHRDVKPANVLLDEQGEPLLADFGLAAREEGGERLTQEGARCMGTPAYMAPEQAAGEAQEASDQYSLGCTLYELLTGQTPFAGPVEVQLYLHHHEEPRSPRHLCPAIPRDLDTLCRKCLEKEPGRRYVSCQALADDLRRWLEGEPIQARRIGLGERLVRWARKDPWLAGALGTAASLLVLVIGVLAASDQAQRRLNGQLTESRDEALSLAEAKTQLAQQNRRLADKERGARELAEKAKAQSEQDKLKAEAEARKASRVAEHLIGTFQASDPLGLNGLTAYIPKGTGETLSARDILDRGADRVLLLEKEPEVQVQLMTTLGEIYGTLGDFPKAQSQLQKALERSEKLSKQVDQRPQRAAILYSMGWLAHQQGDYPRARRLYEETLALSKKKGGEDALVSGSLFHLAWLLAEMRDYSDSEQMFRQVIALRQRQLGPEHRETAVAQLGLAALYIEQERHLEALMLVKQTMPMLVKQEGKEGLAEAVGKFMQGMVQKQLFHDLKGARRYLEESLRLTRRSSLGKQHIYEGLILFTLAQTLEELKETRQAERCYAECMEIARLRVGLGHPRVAVLVRSFASFLDDQGRGAEADRLFEELLAAHRERFGPRHCLVADALVLHGELLYGRNDHVRTERNMREALSIYREPSSSRQGHYSTCLQGLGLACLRQGKAAEAEPFLEEAAASFRKRYGPRYLAVGRTLPMLAEARMDQRKYSGVDRLLTEALRILPASDSDQGYLLNLRYRYHRETGQAAQAVAVALDQRKLRGSDPDALFDVVEELCRCRPLLRLARQGSAESEQECCQREACSTCRQAIELYRKGGGGARYPRYRLCLNRLGTLLTNENPGEAERLYREALPLNRKAFGESHREIAIVLGNLGLALTQQKKYGEAEELLHQALAMHRKVADGSPEFALVKLTSLYQLTNRPAEAVQAALERRRYSKTNAAELYAIAADISRCIPLVGKPKAAPEDDASRERFAREALGVLRQAVEQGFANLAQLRNDPALQPLRAGAELGVLIHDMEVKQARHQPTALR